MALSLASAGYGFSLLVLLSKQLVEETEVYPCERVIFKDTVTGATIWKMTH